MQAHIYRSPVRRIRLRHYVLSILALLVIPACDSDGPHLRFNCATVSGGPADLAAVDTGATPRAQADAEILALEASGEFIAPEPLYQRIVAELAGIRAGFPALAEIGVRPCHLSDSVIVHFTAEGFEQLGNGTYTAWDDFNENLALESIEALPSILLPPVPVALHFEGRYNANRVALGYSGLPEIASAEPNGLAGDGPDICLARRGQDHLYIFRDAHGDCPAGCINENFTALSVDPSGNIAEVGEWDGSGGPPLWFILAADCRAFL